MRRTVALLASAALLANANNKVAEDLLAQLDLDDECAADQGPEQCAINALQLRARKYREAEVAARGELNATTNIKTRGPPLIATSYGGMQWPDITVSGTEPTHIFAIGDWGGMDGTLWTNMWPPNGRARLIAYAGGAKGGPSAFPRTRWNLHHTELLCSHKQFIACYNHKGPPECPETCGFEDGVDTQPQILVAEQLKKLAAQYKPEYILNVGDNFYWGGIETDCGHSMNDLSYEAKHQFDQIFEGVYNGPGLDGVPWISVLGNHDWGGRVFNNGWDQQIAYTWKSNRWIMPAPYYSLTVNYPDQGFSIDYFMIDSNKMDAKDGDEDPEHNICGFKHNSPQASCLAAGGPPSLALCKGYFDQLWETNKQWLKMKLSASTAQWQIVVTHFPCGHEAKFYRDLHTQQGLDMLVTGHRHDQELWDRSHPRSAELAYLPCIVTGGGGGISSEATPVNNDGNWYGEGQYGFYDLLIQKDTITIHSIAYNGTYVKNTTVRPV